MKKTIFVLMLILSALTAGFAQNIIGSIAWIDGTVDVYRNGEALDWWDVDIGLEIEDFDLVETGPDSYLEVEVQTPGNAGTIVKISENNLEILCNIQSNRNNTIFENNTIFSTCQARFLVFYYITQHGISGSLFIQRAHANFRLSF